MKALLFTLITCCCAVAPARAQKVNLFAELPGNNEPSEQKIRAMTRTMADQLHFNEAQYAQMLVTNRLKLIRLDEIQWQYRDNVALQQTKFAELQAQYETECGRILSPTQLSALHESEQRPEALPKTNPTAGGVG